MHRSPAPLPSFSTSLGRGLPPGAPVSEAEHPRLFALVREVARQLDVPMPAAVYLTPDVNAFAVRTGGFLGLGGHTLLGLGLGLLAVDNLSQLRATLAHELAHTRGGERLLAGLLRATRTVLLRLLRHLEPGAFHGLLTTYLRLTQALSRQQELAADAWSMHLAGKQAHLSGLLQESLHGAGFALFLEREVYAPGARGRAPDNVFADYRRFLRGADWRRLRPRLAEVLARQATDPYDACPGLRERLAFARGLALAEQPVDETPAYTLLSGVEMLERRVSAQLWPRMLDSPSWSEAEALAVNPHWSAA